MKITTQIEKGLLVSPESGQKLSINPANQSLSTEDGAEQYPYLKREETIVPVLLLDAKWAEQYSNSSERMVREYSQERVKETLFARIQNRDYRNKASISWFNSLFGPLDNETSLVLSVGGGPSRRHPSFTNVNIAPFPMSMLLQTRIHCLIRAGLSMPFIVRQSWSIYRIPRGQPRNCTGS